MRRAISIVSLLLCLVLMLSCFSACGKKQQVVESEVWVDDSNSDTESEDNTGGESDTTDTSSDKKNNNKNTSSKKNKNSSKNSVTVTDGKYDLGGSTVTIGIFGDNYRPSASSYDYKQKTKLVSDIQKKYNCKFNWKNINDSMQQYKAFATATMAGTKYADIIVVAGDQAFPDAVANGYALQLDKYIDDFTLDVFNKGVNKGPMVINGKHFYLITNIDQTVGAAGVFFNQKVLDACGVKKSPHDLYDENNWNWDTFRDIAINCTKKVGNTQYYGISDINPVPYMHSNGGRIYKTANDGSQTLNLRSKECIEALQFVYDLYNKDKVIMKSGGEKAFTSGYVAMTVCNPWIHVNSDMKFCMMPIGPRANDYMMHYSSLPHCWIIPSTIINKKKSEAENTYRVKAVIEIWKDYFDPTYNWRQTMEEYTMSRYNDEKSGEIACASALKGHSMPITSKYVLPYYEWVSKNVLWSNWGIDQQTAPSAYIASIEQKANAEIKAIWDKALKATK